MQPICLCIPPEVATRMKLPTKRAQKVLMEELVLHLYEEGIISAGQGAYLLDKDRISFERFLAERQIPIHSGVEELEQDIAQLDLVQ
jgi:predicted HTH domain antitoxin